MTTQKKWLGIGAAVAAAAVALALGVSPFIVLLIGLVLLCPASMFFGMGHGKVRPDSGHKRMQEGPAASDQARNTQERKDQTTQVK